MTFLKFINLYLRPGGKFEFISTLPRTARILDVGCGNNSPYKVRRMLPESHYVGIDVGDYNQTRPISANEYITTSGDLFAAQIERFDAFFDAVISSHNLEHCDERDRCLRAMLRALKKDGRIFLSFPCAESVTFPSRKGTLNYYDDYTHKAAPPDLASVKSILQELNCEIEFVSERYSPLVLSAIGAIFEPLSRIRRKTMIGTWEFYGFETILVARRVKI